MTEKLRVICTLTTIPSRLGNLWPVIESMLKQSRPPDHIFINIPRVSRRGVRYSEKHVQALFAKAKAFDCIRILRPTDHGPITKVWPCLPLVRESDWLLIVDDDRLMPPNCIQYFLSQLDLRRGEKVCLSLSGWIRSMFESFCGPNLPTGCEMDWLEGTNGIFCSASDLKAVDLLDYSDFPDPSFQELLQNNDDHWIAYHLHRRGVRLIRVGGELPAMHFTDPKGAPAKESLSGVDLPSRLRFYWQVYRVSTAFQKLGIYRLPGHSVRRGFLFVPVVYTLVSLLLFLFVLFLVLKK